MTKYDIPLDSVCNICNRGNVKVYKYSFNEPKQLLDWNATNIISDNPHALEIIICGSDMNLVAKIKREAKSLSSKQILEKAKEYRVMHPIKA